MELGFGGARAGWPDGGWGEPEETVVLLDGEFAWLVWLGLTPATLGSSVCGSRHIFMDALKFFFPRVLLLLLGLLAAEMECLRKGTEVGNNI